MLAYYCYKERIVNKQEQMLTLITEPEFGCCFFVNFNGLIMPLTGCVAADQITNMYMQNTELLGKLKH